MFGCQEQTTSNDKDNIFYIGNIITGIDEERHRNLVESFRSPKIIYNENNTFCQNCELRDLCYEVACPSAAWVKYNNFFIKSDTDCFWERTTFNLALEALKMYNKNIDEYLHFLLEKYKGDEK